MAQLVIDDRVAAVARRGPGETHLSVAGLHHEVRRRRRHAPGIPPRYVGQAAAAYCAPRAHVEVVSRAGCQAGHGVAVGVRPVRRAVRDVDPEGGPFIMPSVLVLRDRAAAVARRGPAQRHLAVASGHHREVRRIRRVLGLLGMRWRRHGQQRGEGEHQDGGHGARESVTAPAVAAAVRAAERVGGPGGPCLGGRGGSGSGSGRIRPRGGAPPNARRSHRLGSARLGSARLGSARLGSARLGSARLGSARLGSARLGSARLGSARLGSARLGSARLGSARLGSARLGSARLGSARLIISISRGKDFINNMEQSCWTGCRFR